MKTTILSAENRHLIKKGMKIVSIFNCDCGCGLKADKVYTLKEIRENKILGNMEYFLSGNGVDETAEFSAYLLYGERFYLYNGPDQLEFDF